jgi:molybdopterin-guanine dinucleotide biosynthesis protein A
MDFVKSGNLSPKAFLALHPVKKIKADNSENFLNINYPSDGNS